LLDKPSFIERVNTWAQAHNAPGVTARMLEDWNEEAVFAPALSIPSGDKSAPEWRYGRIHYRRALVICRLKRQGLTRYSAIRATLWLLGMERLPPVEDLAIEWARQSKQLVAGISSTIDPSIEGISGKKTDTLIRQMGELSPHLDVEGIRPSKEFLLDGYQAGRFGGTHQDIIPFVNQFLLRAFGKECQIGELNLAPVTNLMSGLMGSADEIDNSGDALIRAVGSEALNRARRYVTLFVNSTPQGIALLKSLNILNAETIDELSPPFLAVARAAELDPRWRLVMLVLGLKLANMPLGGLPKPLAGL
jgi:hypothetical protein